MNPPVGSPAVKVVKSVQEQVSPEEWQARVDLAACYRLTAMYGMTEMVANHISCRVPGTTDQFLINPYGMLYEEIDASSLIKIDVEGNTLFNASDYDVNVAGFVIHSAIHMAKHDMDCVAHTHTPAGMAVSAMECGLLPLAQTSMRFLHIAYHDFEGIADNVDERERLVRDLGDNEAMILRNHGLLVVGRTDEVPAICRTLIERFTRAGMGGSAMTALAFLRETVATGHATPDLVRHVHDFLRDVSRTEASSPVQPVLRLEE